MFLTLSKFLPLFVYPLGLACVVLAAALLLRRRKWASALVVVALAALWLGGNRVVSMALVSVLEGRYRPINPADLPPVDAIVVLGGGTSSAAEPRQLPDLNRAADRLLYGAWLYQQGVAPVVVVSGGVVGVQGPALNPGAENMAQVLGIMGVPSSAVLLEPNSRNTYENAVEVKTVLQENGLERVLLVTSAVHMPRSAAIFDRQDLDFVPAPTDFLVTEADWDHALELNVRTQLFNLVPHVEYLYDTTFALKELIGLVVYRLRGWV